MFGKWSRRNLLQSSGAVAGAAIGGVAGAAAGHKAGEVVNPMPKTL